MLEERNDSGKAIGPLGKRFKPLAIEELRGMEFHQLMQDSRVASVQALSCTLLQPPSTKAGRRKEERRERKERKGAWDTTQHVPPLSSAFFRLFCGCVRVCTHYIRTYERGPDRG